MVGSSVEELSVGWWSVVVGSVLIWLRGWWSVVGEPVEDLSVIGSLWTVACRWSVVL